ncbi:MAG: hypothetical protein K2P92_03965 [Bdellovibrionaceae bacterium]|nr:hypothetical protein [Pseudobdellovibrionaceae bacterium]
MSNDPFQKIAHLYLGLSRQEFARRVRDGLIDCQILKSQIEQNSYEMTMETRCEKLLILEDVDQVDKFAVANEPSLS